LHPILHIELLGHFTLSYRDQPVRDLSTMRLQSLLAYLVLNPVPQPRQHLAFLFWSESTEAQARTNLRREYHHLRRILPEAGAFLADEGSTIHWRPDSPYTLDVRAFEAAVAAAQQADQAGDLPAARQQLIAAAQAYRGELLPGAYDGWLLAERERLGQLYARGLERLVGLLEAERDWAQAITLAQRLLQHDPLREATYRDLMRLHSLNGDRSAALRVYHNGATTLQRELGVEPEPATRALYQQLMAGGDAGRMSPAPSPPPSKRPPLIGRRREWATWEGVWKAAANGQPQVLCLAGEAGIGKSRLAEEMQHSARRQGAATAWARCYAAEGGLAFAPVAEWLKNTALQSARAGLQPLWLAELVRLLPELLIERPELPAPQPLTENWQRLRLFEAVARAVLAARPPLLLVMDDLQWCDSDTLAWLRYLLRFDAAARLLVVITVRVEELPTAPGLQRWLSDLRQAGQLTEVAIGALDAAETAALAAQLIGQAPEAEFARLIFQETEGNPLFIVQTVPTGPHEPIEAALAPRRAALALPPGVHTVIAARLAQLSPSARELASLAATSGRAFTFAVLAGASGRAEDDVARDLDELWQRRIVREQGGEAYDFSHDKIREVAYAQVSGGHRRLLHRHIAQALERAHTADLDTVSHQIAAHYDQAGLPARAIPFYRRAAAVAQAVYANEKAVGLLNKGLAALADLPAGAERDEHELALQSALGVPLVALKGYMAPEVRSVYTRARQLCQSLGRAPDAPILRALALTSIMRSEFGEAYELGEQLRRLAEQRGDAILVVEAHYVLGVSLFWLGQFEASRLRLEQALDAYDPSLRQAHIALYAQDPAVIGLVRLAYTLWHLGYPDQAREKFEAGLALAREVGHPFSLGYAQAFGACYTNDRRDLALTAQLIQANQDLAAEQGFTLWSMMSALLDAGVQAEQGEAGATADQIRARLVEYGLMGASLGRTYILALLARAYARDGQFALGLETLDEALGLVAEGEEQWYAAELNRLRGELMLSAGADGSEVETWYHRALEIAQPQCARFFELRAALSLSRLWQRQDRAQPARQLLQAVYAKFTEGFDTPDLLEAQAQLQALTP
jgi:DNA-binding SARP family transcriptional activator/predicted ATPase